MTSLLRKPSSLLSLFALPLLVLLLPATTQAASTCAGFIPATINTPTLLVQAFQAAQGPDCPGADTIDLAGQTITLTQPFATYDGSATALPAITTPVTLSNGVIERSTAGGTPVFRLLSNAAGGTLTLTNMTLRNGNGGISGIGNRGGAISNAGTLLVQQSSLTSNYAYNTGAIYNAGGATATITRSTISGNQATYSASGISSVGTLNLSNSTISGNSTTSGSGAVLNDTGGVATLTNVTISNNESLTGNSSGGLNSLGNITLYNSIIANNTGFDCARLGGLFNFSPGATNLIEAQRPGLECGVAGTNFVTVDPQLGALTGSPAYHPLTAVTLAVSGGDNASTGGATVDQPGNARVQFGTVDLGSAESTFERQLVSVAFDAAASSASEAAGIGNVVRVMTNDGNVTAAAITATLAVTGGTATGADYMLTGTLSIPAGTPNNALVSVASAITVVNDNSSEPSETLQLTLSAPVNASLGAQATHTHTINDDDMSTVTIADVAQAEGNAGSSTMTFTLQLDNPVQGGFAVTYATNDISASAGSDYVAATGTLTFAGTAGETQTVAVSINGDTLVEPNEAFRLIMPTAATLGMVNITDTATGTIINDDTATLTIADASITEGNSGASTLSFTATLSQAVQGGYTVNYATANGTATSADGDYVAATGTLNFSGIAGETRSFSVTVNGDTKVEPDEFFTVTLNTGSSPSVDISDSATGTITNDDSAELTIADAGVTEGNTGTTNLIFTVTLNNAVAGGFTVNYASADGTATTADNDYVAATGTLTFTGTAGQTRTFIVQINGDTKVESNETFAVSLNTVSNAGVTITDTATGTITNNDTSAVTIANVTQPENGTFTFTATLSNAVQGGVNADYQLAGVSATAGTDFTATGGTLNFTGTTGETRTFTVPVFDDSIVESSETFTVSMSNASSASVNITDTATGTITDNDSAAVTIADVSLAEGNGGTQLMTFTALLNNAVQGGFTLNYATANGSASTADADYAAATGTLTFAGTAGEAQTFSVTINGDTKVEPDETFLVSMNTVSNAAVTISDTATGTIGNDDTAALTIADVSLDEGNAGITTMTFTATLSAAVQGGFTVSYASADGTATVADNDYAATSGTLTFAGTAGEAQTFSVSVNGDTQPELDESFSVALNTVSNAGVVISDTAMGTIRNDDAVVVNIGDVSLVEGNAATTLMTFTASINGAVPGGFTVNYTTNDGTATAADNDFAAATGTLTFAGMANESQTFTVTLNGDSKVEADETFSVALNTASVASLDISRSAIGTIRNDDAATVTVADASIAEGNAGPTLLTFTATLDNAVQGAFSVDYATSDGTATTADNDYTAALNKVTFVGTAGETRTFTIALNGDTRVEADETFIVTLSGSTYPALSINDTATGTISNDDGAAVTLADVSLAEGNGGTSVMTFTATLDNAVAGGFTVNYTTADGTATTADNDYAAASGTLTFAGTAGETQTLSVTVNGDAKVEADETFSIALSGVSQPAVTITDTATGTISNDDTASVTIADVSLPEGNASTSLMTFSATLDSAVQGGFTVNYASADGTATTADNDYAAASGTLTFSGQAGETQVFTVTLNGDTRLEPAETFTISMNTVSNANLTITDTATGTIANDDSAAVTIADVSQAEGNAGATVMTVIATVDNAVAGGFTVNYATANGTATVADSDYAAASGTLTFAGTAGETQTFSVTINGDTRVESDETFSIALSNASNADVAVTDTATGTIRNDDGAALTLADVSLDEGNAGTSLMTFTVTLDQPVAGGFTVSYASADGTATTADNDYAAATGTLSFAGTVGETQTFSVTINGDTRLEADETFGVALSNASNASVSTSDTATGTLRNDDAAAVTIADMSLAEGNTGTATLTFTATLDAAVAGGFTVDYATADAAATTADNDYIAANGTLTFAGTAGETRSFAVTINGDSRYEPDETFTVALSAVSNAAVVITDTATGTLRNDDAAPGFIVTPAAGLLTTEAGGTAIFTVALTSQPAAGVTVALSSSNPGEGTVAPVALIFDAANWNSPQTVTVSGVDDNLVDGDVAYSIVTAPAVSIDPAFDTLDAPDVSVTNRDDDAGALLSATKRVMQVGTAAQPVIYEIVITNSGGPQADDPASDELVDVLPATLALQSATASAGSISTAGNTVRWNGALATGATATLRITARVATTLAGPISNQAQLHYDSNGDGSNDATALSDDPTTPGLDATVFGFVPASVAIPLLDAWKLAWLALCLAALALAALRSRAG